MIIQEQNRPVENTVIQKLSLEADKVAFWTSLTPSERETVIFVAGDFSQIETAEHLGVHRETIDRRMDSIGRKGGVVFGHAQIDGRIKHHKHRIKNDAEDEKNTKEAKHTSLIHMTLGSLYAAYQNKAGNIFTGGSVWDRRSCAFTPLTRSARGVLNSLVHQNGIFENDREKQLYFPSMVNAIVPIGEDVIVCCKHSNQALNRVNRSMDIIKTSDDGVGGGIYNAFLNSQTHELIAATRNGHLLYVDPKTLKTNFSIKLAGQDTRLWSLAQMENGVILAGDYKGFLHVVADHQEIHKFYLPEIAAEETEKHRQQYDPSLFGLTVLNDQTIVAGLRWGHLTWIDGVTFDVIKTLELPWEISALSSVGKSRDLIIGTREGILLHLKDYGHIGVKLKLICEIPPVRQNDNSIWSISATSENSGLACFADGQVVHYVV